MTLDTAWQEAAYGRAWAAMARKEGHAKKLPKMSLGKNNMRPLNKTEMTILSMSPVTADKAIANGITGRVFNDAAMRLVSRGLMQIRYDKSKVKCYTAVDP